MNHAAHRPPGRPPVDPEPTVREFVHQLPATRVVLAAGARHRLPGEIARLGWNRILLIGGAESLRTIRDELAAALGATVAARIVDVAQHVPATVRCIFTANDEDARDWLSAAYLIGLGVRAANEMTHDGEVGWTIELLNAEPSFASLDDLRAWSELGGTPVESTWTSDGQGHPIEQAWSVAQEASRSGHMVRLHTCDLLNASEAAVDVFDAPIPASRDD